mgnify:CR=1 FL=1|jgi:hypothetical protein
MSVNEELMRLVKENPELPIIPVVSIEGACDDNSCFYGKVVSVCIGECAEWDGQIYDDKDFFIEKYYDLNDDWICDIYRDNDAIESYLEKTANDYFKKAILLYIDV